MNNLLNEYLRFNFELNHFLARFNVKMNNQNLSATPTCTSVQQVTQRLSLPRNLHFGVLLISHQISGFVDISPAQQLLHTGEVSIEKRNVAPMDWVGILGQKQ